MKKLLFIFLLFYSSIQAQNTFVPKGTEPYTPYGYVYNIPDTSAHKLLISLHGLGELGNGTTDLVKVTNVGVAKRVKLGTWNRKEFISVSPQFSTTAGFYHETLHTFIVQMCKKFKVPQDQVYIMGISMGAISAYKYVVYLQANNLKYGTSIKPRALVAIAGDSPDYAKAGNFTYMKLWVLYGQYDVTTKVIQGKYWVEYYNKAVSLNNANSANRPLNPAQLTIYPFEKHTSYVFDKSYQQDAYL
jgi:predicted peptidase